MPDEGRKETMRRMLLIVALLPAVLLGACEFSLVPADRLDADAGGDLAIPAGEEVTLRGAASGGLPPYKFRWSLERQPDDANLELPEANTFFALDLGVLDVEGQYVFRFRVTDSNGKTDDSFVTVNLGGDLPITAKTSNAVATVGEVVTLGVDFDADSSGLENPTYAWAITRGSAELGDSAAPNPELTILGPETIELSVNVTGEIDGELRFGVSNVVVVGINDATPQVVMTVGGAVQGEIVFEMLSAVAPKTVANFLRYVDDRYYDGIVWHRVAPGFVIQGGAFIREGDQLVIKEGRRPAVESEANNGESNVTGTVAMALKGQDADSGDSQFFVNLGSNQSLDNGSPPFTVFARVIKGMGVVEEIAALETGTDASGLTDVPLEDVVMESVRRADEEVPAEDVDTNGQDVDTSGVDADTNGMLG